MACHTQRCRFRPAISQGFQTLGQGSGVRDIRHRRVELRHDVLGHGNGIAQRVAAFTIKRGAGTADATNPYFQGSQHAGQ